MLLRASAPAFQPGCGFCLPAAPAPVVVAAVDVDSVGDRLIRQLADGFGGAGGNSSDGAGVSAPSRWSCSTETARRRGNAPLGAVPLGTAPPGMAALETKVLTASSLAPAAGAGDAAKCGLSPLRLRGEFNEVQLPLGLAKPGGLIEDSRPEEDCSSRASTTAPSTWLGDVGPLAMVAEALFCPFCSAGEQCAFHSAGARKVVLPSSGGWTTVACPTISTSQLAGSVAASNWATARRSDRPQFGAGALPVTTAAR